MFEENYRPISPILWMCLQGKNTCLDKPLSVTLPHILTNSSEEELASFRVRFAKANHDCDINAHGKKVYMFQPFSKKPSYYIDGGDKGYGVIQVDHFSFMCLEAGSTIDHEIAQRKGYQLSGVIGPSSQLRVYATYSLNTCVPL